MMTDEQIEAYKVAAEREFLSMLAKFGAETPRDRVQHAAMIAGFKDGLASMASEVRRQACEPDVQGGALPVAPIDALKASVREALAVYARTGDHRHVGGHVGDCIACALKALVSP